MPDAPAVTSAALTRNTTPVITGTAEAGSTVTVTIGGATYTTTATGGNWSVNLATAR
ncbi:Ig-like domain-containing protein [Azospirillum brasilense]|uniref:Ig-like domain-containing protein n=1 Tax=Azospirillum brasilense TaxID=192 RepID=UPI001FEB2946|nr:Ig-like domain-containing protein [Azospirillum brasilense]